MNLAALLLVVGLSWGGLDAELTVDSNGRLSVSVAGQGEWFALEADDWAPGDDTVEVVDVDFDGLDDLKVRVGVGAYNETFSYYRFSPEARTLVPVPVLQSIGSPTFDAVSRTITSSHKIRAWGDLWEETTFEYGPQGWVPVRQVRVDLENPLDLESPVVESIREFRDGRWYEVSREVMEEDE